MRLTFAKYILIGFVVDCLYRFIVVCYMTHTHIYIVFLCIQFWFGFIFLHGSLKDICRVFSLQILFFNFSAKEKGEVFYFQLTLLLFELF